MSENRYNNYSSGLKKSTSSYTVNKENYQKTNQVNNDDILTRKIKDNVKVRTVNYAKGVSKQVLKSPYTIAKGIYKLDKAVDSYLSKPTEVRRVNSKKYIINKNTYNKARSKFLDNKYSSKKAMIQGTLAQASDKRIHINKSRYNFVKNKNRRERFKWISSTNVKRSINIQSKYEFRGTLRFENKKPVDFNKARVQRKFEDFGRYLGKRKEFKLRNIRDEKLSKWISKKYRFREKLRGSLKNRALYPYNSTKSTFKDTFKKVREGENEVARETIQKIEKQGKRVIDTGKYLVKGQLRKAKFARYQRIKVKQLNKKIERVSSINRFKRNNASKLNKGRFSGKERFFKKRRDLRQFKRQNRYLLRQRFVDRLKLGFKDFISALKNPIKLISGLFRGLSLLKTILLIVIPFVIIASVFSSIGMQVKTNAVNEKSVLVEQDRIFSALHSSKYNEQAFLNEVKSKYPGYDKYSVDLSDVGYDNYELLAFLNIAYGNIEDNKDEMMGVIRKELSEIFSMLYTEEKIVTRETKIEYKEVVNEDGTVDTVPVEKTYKYLKVRVKKVNTLKNIYLAKLNAMKEDNWFYNEEIADADIEEWFDELVKNKLGVSGLFAVTINGNVAINGIISREAFSPENSEFGEPRLNNIDPNGHGYAFGQCTWYSFQRRSEIGRPLAHSFFGDGGSWWVTARSLGMSVDHSPRAGDVASFPGGVAGAFHPWGHVAFVEKVNPDGSIEVSEMHGGNTVDGIIRYRHIPKEAIPYTYFIH